MAASWTAGLPKLSMAMRGQTLSASRRRTASAVVRETFSTAVCRGCLPARHVLADDNGRIAARLREKGVATSLTTFSGSTAPSWVMWVQAETTAGAPWLLARVKQVRSTCRELSSPLPAKPLATGLQLGVVILPTGNVNKD